MNVSFVHAIKVVLHPARAKMHPSSVLLFAHAQEIAWLRKVMRDSAELIIGVGGQTLHYSTLL